MVVDCSDQMSRYIFMTILERGFLPFDSMYSRFTGNRVREKGGGLRQMTHPRFERI